MDLFNLIAIILALTTVFAYFNEKFLKLPETIGLMSIALLFSIVLFVLQFLGVDVEHHGLALFKNIDFSETVLGWMLGFLLFAGALNIHIIQLVKDKWIILVLALIGTIISTFLIGAIMYGIFLLLGMPIPWIYSLLFGALISPTDPIAVLSMLKNADAPTGLQTKIAGESLFNDGIGIVIFLSLLQFVTSKGITTGEVFLLFLREAFGGFILGLIFGWIGVLLLKTISSINVALLITLTLVTGGYAIALALDTSGPIAMVVAGLVVGNFSRQLKESEKMWENMDTFWALVDEILNALLFVLIGLEVLQLEIHPFYLIAGVIAIVVVLFSRWVSVWIPIRIFSFFDTFMDRIVFFLTWGGLRGALPVAMALTLPRGLPREIILSVTYIVVIFSILVQGLSMQTIIFKKKN